MPCIGINLTTQQSASTVQYQNHFWKMEIQTQRIKKRPSISGIFHFQGFSAAPRSQKIGGKLPSQENSGV